MISPTGKGIRNDSEGSGEYGSRRGSRVHNGIDYLCDEGQIVVAPFDLYIERSAKPYGDIEKNGIVLEGIKWIHKKSSGKMFYFKPDDNKIDKFVKQGEVIGIAQSVSRYYDKPKMKDHIHFQIDN